MDQPTSKACTKCREVKPLEAFTPGAGGKFGRRSRCKDCSRKPRKTPVRIKTDTHRECSRCGEVLPLGEFWTNPYGARSSCKKCSRQMNIDWQRRNPDRCIQRVVAWQKANPEHGRLCAARRRARKLAATIQSFTIAQQFQRAQALGDRCWMCGTPDWSHWDHVKPLSKGGAHCLANLRPACASCNRKKGARWYGVDGLSRFLVG